MYENDLLLILIILITLVLNMLVTHSFRTFQIIILL